MRTARKSTRNRRTVRARKGGFSIMNQPMKWVENNMPKSDDAHLKVMALDEVMKARAFH